MAISLSCPQIAQYRCDRCHPRIALAVVAFCMWRFKFSHVASEGSKRNKKSEMEAPLPAGGQPVEVIARQEIRDRRRSDGLHGPHSHEFHQLIVGLGGNGAAVILKK